MRNLSESNFRLQSLIRERALLLSEARKTAPFTRAADVRALDPREQVKALERDILRLKNYLSRVALAPIRPVAKPDDSAVNYWWPSIPESGGIVSGSSYFGFPSQVFDPARNRFVAVYRKGTHYSSADPGTIWVTFRTAGQWRWSPPVQIKAGTNLSEPSIALLPDGRLFMSFGDVVSGSDYRPRYSISDDGGSSWGADQLLPDTIAPGLVYASGALVVTGSGRWVLPCYANNSGVQNDVAAIWYTDDDGASWDMAQVAVGYNETELLVDGGELVAWSRRDDLSSAVWTRRTSVDEGVNWGEPSIYYANADEVDAVGTRPNVFVDSFGTYWSCHRGSGFAGVDVLVSTDGQRWLRFDTLEATRKFVYGSFAQEGGTVSLVFGLEAAADPNISEIRFKNYSKSAAAGALDPEKMVIGLPSVHVDATGEPNGAAGSGIVKVGGAVTLSPTLEIVDSGEIKNVEVSAGGLVRFASELDFLIADGGWAFGSRFVLEAGKLLVLLSSNGTSNGSRGVSFWVDDRVAAAAAGRLNIRIRGAGGVVFNLSLDHVLTPSQEHTLIISSKPGAHRPMVFAIDGFPIFSNLLPSANHGGQAATDPAMGGILTTGGSVVDGGGEIGRTLLYESPVHSGAEILAFHKLLKS
jgi:hypothetical protein